jgi:ectoine hydroxylase-related dioxygenase (phytanoyl-CoA dioxygenase family)
MDFVRPTPEQLCAFNDDGFLVVRKVLNRAQIDSLIKAGDRLAEAFLKKPVVMDRPEFNHLDLRPGLLEEPALLDLVGFAPTISLLAQLLSPNIHLHSTALIYKRPENPDAPTFRRGWHRDIRIPEDLGNSGLPRVGIKVCYCLADFHRPDAGMTLMARGTHLRQEPLVIRRGESDPEGVEVCDLRLDAGDALLFENRTFHTAAPNRSDRVSRVIIYGYAYRWMKPEVYLDPPDQRFLEGANLILRQLLGGYRDIDMQPWALQEWARANGVTRERVPWAVEAPGGAGIAF